MQVNIRYINWIFVPIGIIGMLYSYFYEISLFYYLMFISILIIGILTIQIRIKIDFFDKKMNCSCHILLVVFKGNSTLYSKCMFRNNNYYRNKRNWNEKTLPAKLRPEYQVKLIQDFCPELQEIT